MRIGLLVDGDAERAALPELLGQLKESTGHSFLNPVRPAVHPKASPARIARACQSEIDILVGKGVDRIVVLLDREDRADCPTQIAQQVEQAIRAHAGGEAPVVVVVKDRCFENWLVADPDAIAASPARFSLPASVRAALHADQADHLDAVEILKKGVTKGSDNKVRDSKRILARCRVERMAGGSRSFRRFLRCLDHPLYSNQSKRPAPQPDRSAQENS